MKVSAIQSTVRSSPWVQSVGRKSRLDAVRIPVSLKLPPIWRFAPFHPAQVVSLSDRELSHLLERHRLYFSACVLQKVVPPQKKQPWRLAFGAQGPHRATRIQQLD